MFSGLAVVLFTYIIPLSSKNKPTTPTDGKRQRTLPVATIKRRQHRLIKNVKRVAALDAGSFAKLGVFATESALRQKHRRRS